MKSSRERQRHSRRKAKILERLWKDNQDNQTQSKSLLEGLAELYEGVGEGLTLSQTPHTGLLPCLGLSTEV